MQPMSQDERRVSGKPAGHPVARVQSTLGGKRTLTDRKAGQAAQKSDPTRRFSPGGWAKAVFLSTVVSLGVLAVDNAEILPEAVDPVAKALGFKQSKLIVTGNHLVNEQQIETLLQTQLQGSSFTTNAEDVRAQLLKSPWFQAAEVTKIYPDILAIDVIERQPFAFWKSEEQIRLIARDGTVLGAALAEHMNLPQVVGAGANVAATEFIATISKFPDLSARSKAFVRIAERRWNLALAKGTTVLLPEQGWREALHELQQLQRNTNILERDIKQIDMRLKDRLVVKLPQTMAKQRREQLENILDQDGQET